ncbi:MAG: hypothetical protein JST92_15545, partial [Deltaproteobacteria bacterium]|nr:hypothetical protein [Deltaproteobacteria bacterium]
MKAAAHLTLAAAALLCACGQSAPEGGRPLQAPGQVKLAFDTRLPPVTAQPASGSGSAPLLLPAICADFTLTPYSIDASGHHAQAGDPIQISETAAGTTAFIGGCTDSSAGDDWGYVVSATHWHLCPGDVLSQGFTDYVGAHFGGDVDAFLATLSPQIATSSIDLDCQAGKDIDADISVDVSVPIASSAGYVDIGVSVDVSQQSVGCKQADFGADGTLHFGEAAQYPQGQAAPLGFTGIGLLTPTLDPDLTPGAAPDAASVDQFAGVVTLGNTSTAFYTGTLAVSGGASYDVLQAFAPQCGDGMYYAQTQAVECDTRATQGAQGAWSAQTYAGLADVLMVVPGRLWVSARVGQANTLLLTTGTGSAASDASVPASAWNPLTLRQVLDFGAQGLTLLGVWPNQEQPSDLVALVDDGSGPGYIDVSFDAGAGTWSLDRRGATSLDGMSASDLASLGLFQQTNGCLKGVFHETTTTVTIDASSVFLGGHALSGTLSPLCGEVLVKPLVVSQDSFVGASNVSLLDDQHVTLDERVGTAKVNIFGGNLADRIDLRFAIESLAPCDAPGAVLPAFGGYPAQASYLSVTAGGLASAALP